MRRIFGDGRYANVTATLAVVLGLGGTAWAATTITSRDIRNGSIKTVDLGNSSVTGAKVKNGTLTSRDFRGGVIRGPKGDKGDPGPPGATTGSGVVTELTAGQSLRGYVNVAGEPEAANEVSFASVSFPVPLPAAPTPHYIGAANPVCPGTAASPAAAAGHLCVYQASAVNLNAASPAIVELSRFGFTLRATNAAGMAGGQPFNVSAHWAVTAG